MHSHRKWTRTLGATVALLIVTACAGDILLPRWLNLDREPLDEDLVEKVHSLLVEPGRIPPVIVAGDSRAQRQVIPALIRERLGVDAVNIAVAGGELVSVAKVVEQQRLAEKKPLLVLSATVFQINDGAIDHDTFSMDCLLAMPWIDQIALFREKLPEMAYRKIRMYKRCLAARFGLSSERTKHFAEDGFMGIEGTFDASGMQAHPENIKHPWYANLKLEGCKWRVFQAALRKIAGSGVQVLLYNGPSSPAWRQLSHNTFMDAAEEQYSRMLEHEAAQYPNVHFMDFHGGWIDDFPDALFYDTAHLNRTGAAKLTMILCDEIERLKLLSHEAAPGSRSYRLTPSLCDGSVVAYAP
jgi:hypothetical protein